MITSDDGENLNLVEGLWEVFQNSPLQDVFEEPSDISTLFESMSSLFTDEQIEALKGLINNVDEEPINNSICLTNRQRETRQDGQITG